MVKRSKNTPKKTVGKSRLYVVMTVLLVMIAVVIWAFTRSSGRTAFSVDEEPTDRPPGEVEALAGFAPHTMTVRYDLLVQNYLPLRAAPSGESEEIGRIPVGEQVEVLDWVGPYYKVRSARTAQTGYVVAGFVEPSQPDAFLAAEGIVDVSKADYSYDEMMDDLHELADRYPGLVTLGTVGASLDGRDIPVAVVGNPNAAHAFLIHASIHSREHLCTPLVMKQMEYFLSQYQSGAYDGDQDYMKDVAFHVIPMVNPDGVMLSQQGLSAIRNESLRQGLEAIYSRDVERGVTDLDEEQYFVKWKANARGVNLNLNFDAAWDTIEGSDEPSTSAYPGTGPGSEPESKALIDYTLDHDFDGTISYHAYGSGYYWDFGQEGQLREDTRQLAWLIQSISGYLPLEDVMGEASAGGYKDWALDALGIPSLTIEIGSTSCPLQIREFPTTWERNRDVWAVSAAWACAEAVIG